jgi:hypothetical protein
MQGAKKIAVLTVTSARVERRPTLPFHPALTMRPVLGPNKSGIRDRPRYFFSSAAGAAAGTCQAEPGMKVVTLN